MKKTVGQRIAGLLLKVAGLDSKSLQKAEAEYTAQQAKRRGAVRRE